MTSIKSNEIIIENLSKIADNLNKKGKPELVEAVNKVLSLASRPKAPLKKLDEDVKKDLMKFLTTVKGNMEESMEALEELFRRLRYFGIDDIGHELGLDRILKDMEKTHECMDGAGRAMYALTYGKKPSQTDLDQMADDFGLKNKDKPRPLDFFEGVGKLRGGFDTAERDQEMEEEDLDEASENTLNLLNVSKPSPAVEDEDLSDEDFDNFWDFEDDEE